MSSLAIRGVQSMSGPVIGALALAAALWFATRTARTLRGEGDAGSAGVAAAVAAPAPRAPEAAAPARPVYDAATLVARNMFCATCTATTTPPGGEPPPPGGRRFTARLIATSVESPTRGAATLSDPITGVAGWFPIGAVAPGGAIVAAVRRTAIDVRFPDGALETVTLDGTTAAPPPPPPPAATGALDDRVRSLGDDRWEVERSLIAELVGGGATTQVKGVRLMPVAAGGKLAGIKVAMARTGSLARTLGLEPGDVISAVDGKPVDAAGLMALYGDLDRLSSVALTVDRGGATRTLTYSLK